MDFENFDEDLLKKVTTGAALKISGRYVESQGKGQAAEIQVEALHVWNGRPKLSYTTKKHSFEFLREKAHLRVRTATFSAVMRVRAA